MPIFIHPPPHPPAHPPPHPPPHLPLFPPQTMCKLLPVKGHLLSRLGGEALKLVPLLHHPQSDSLSLWGDGPAPLRHATHTQLQRAAAALLSCHDTIIASLGQPATAAAPNGGEAKGGGRGSTPAYQVREAPNM